VSNQLQSQASEMRRKYLREWRKKNPEKVRQYNREYWQRKAAKTNQDVDGTEEGDADAVH